MPVALTAIKDVSVKDWVTGETITPGKMGVDYRAIRDAVNEIILFLREMEKRFASGEPIDKANGFLWYDAATALLKLYRSSAWEEVMGEWNGFSKAVKAGGGTATGTMGGPINVETTTIEGNDFSIGANTLNADGRFLRQTTWGTGVGIASIATYFGITPSLLKNHTGIDQKCFMETMIIRSAAGSQKWCSFSRFQSDGLAATDRVGSGTSSEDETVSLLLRADISGSATPNARIIEWG